ncbi:MAG: translation initiation factor IF-2, partial [Myxococcales bacterium]|nr:translation initiation factor IF-2 [Myxococcales bacterium]
MAAKVRVYEIAKELDVDNRELVNRVASLGIPVRNHMSVLDAADVERVKRAFEKGKGHKVIEERIRPTVVRRRAVAKSEEPAAAVMEESASAPAKSEAPERSSRPEVADSLGASSEASVTESSVPAPVSSGHKASTPASVRLGHVNLPPGVIARGSAAAPSALPPSANAVSRIVSQNAPANRVSDGPRRRELGRAALGPSGRQAQGGRPMRRKQAAGKKGQKTEITTPSAQKRVIRIEGEVGLQPLASRMSLKSTDLLMKLMQLGMTNVNINTTLDTDTAKIIANEFGYEVENVAKSETDLITEARGAFRDQEQDWVSRSPVITIMGHVDHGKTSLLDKIRATDVAAREAGGITQHIGAYRVETKHGKVVFLDTPGHEAFTAMRARGAQATDIVILVCAADDGVMPQTREAANHAKDAEVPIVVAINKMDRPDARPDVIKNELAAEGLQPEDWGGEVQYVEVSAKTGAGLDQLLDSVLLQAEMLDLKANPGVPAHGTVLEAYLDRGRGPVANVLVQNGTLRAGDVVVVGNAWGKVRAMTDDRGKSVAEAGPATPVEVLGLSEMPNAGDALHVVTNSKKAQEIADARKQQSVSKAPVAKIGLDKLHEMMLSGDALELKLVVKADVQGSIEALEKALTDLSSEKVKVNVIHTGVGGITENDVILASASNAIVVGFNVRPAGNAGQTAKKENVDVRLYSIIYEAVDEVKKAMTGLLKPTFTEKSLGRAEVRQTFGIPKIGTIAGCFVLEGKMSRGAKIRVTRDSVNVWEGQMRSLRRFKDDAK